jgi:hypothetical protein
MRRRIFVMGSIVTLFATLNATISHAFDWLLVTQEEFDRERLEAKADGPRPAEALAAPVPGAPKIEVKRPDLTQTIKVPINIVVTFLPERDAKINLSSFRAVYGAFIKLDITEKIKAHAKLDESGLVADSVSLPAGKHTVSISIADDRGRIGARTIEFTVA